MAAKSFFQYQSSVKAYSSALQEPYTDEDDRQLINYSTSLLEVDANMMLVGKKELPAERFPLSWEDIQQMRKRWEGVHDDSLLALEVMNDCVVRPNDVRKLCGSRFRQGGGVVEIAQDPKVSASNLVENGVHWKEVSQKKLKARLLELQRKKGVFEDNVPWIVNREADARELLLKAQAYIGWPPEMTVVPYSGKYGAGAQMASQDADEQRELKAKQNARNAKKGGWKNGNSLRPYGKSKSDKTSKAKALQSGQELKQKRKRKE
jgi:hypothetical protein